MRMRQSYSPKYTPALPSVARALYRHLRSLTNHGCNHQTTVVPKDLQPGPKMCKDSIAKHPIPGQQGQKVQNL